IATTSREVANTTALKRVVERIFLATSMEGMAKACQDYADACLPGAQVCWHPAQDSTQDRSEAFLLATDTDSGRRLEIRQRSPDASWSWEWIRRLLQQRQKQLGELQGLFDTVSRLARSERLQR